jgi:hypothetical protein
MTIAIAWVATKNDSRQDLYFASDSRTRGVRVLDVSPKILTLPRSDCAICFAGDTSATYAFMIQIANAIAAHEPARERNLDIVGLKEHLLRVLSDIVGSVRDEALPFEPSDAQLIFGGYSWRSKDFRLWTMYYEASSKQFRARESASFHNRLNKAAFIGDWAKEFRHELIQELNREIGGRQVLHEPLHVLAEILRSAAKDATIGGAPQVVRIGPHMNIRPLCVIWGIGRKLHLFGRPLFEYERCDFWTIDPDSGEIHPPRHFRLDINQDSK